VTPGFHLLSYFFAGTPLIPCGKKPAISLPIRNRQRTEGRPEEAVASAPSHAGEAGAERSTPWQSGSRSTGDCTPNFQEQTAPSKAVGTDAQVVSDSPLSAQRPSTNFIKADSAAKFLPIQDLVKSWELVTPGTSDPPKVTEEEVPMVEAFT